MAKFAEKSTSESEALSGCTLRQPSWVMEADSIEFIGPVHEWEPTGEAWSHFRAPNGYVYEIVQGPKR
jgi:hypothetical protein